MADTQDSPGSNLFFKGTDGNECEAFVVAIRDLAFANGKEEDCHWMLHYATTRLRGKALRWHAKLDPSVRKDWDLFVQALFEEYPFVKDSVDDEIATPVWSSTTLTLTPPAIGSLLNDVPPHSAVTQPHNPQPFGMSALHHLPRIFDPLFQGLHVGRLRILLDGGSTSPLYIWCGPPQVEKCPANKSRFQSYEGLDWKSVTTNVREALVVSFVAVPEPHHIGCLNSRSPDTRNLGVQLCFSDFQEHHPIIGASVPFQPRSIEKERGSIRNYQLASTIWNVLTDGTLQATLADTFQDPRDPYTYQLSDGYSTTTVYVDISGGCISFTKDYNVQGNPNPASTPSVRARIVFEPL